jgi:hypothetical protein
MQEHDRRALTGGDVVQRYIAKIGIGMMELARHVGLLAAESQLFEDGAAQITHSRDASAG